MSAIPYVKRKFGTSRLVWFQNSNNFIQFEEPAWFVFRKTVKRYKAETIALEFSDRYGIPYEECLGFVTEIRSGIAKLNIADDTQNAKEYSADEVNSHTYIPFAKHNYKLGNKLISFAYETGYLENFIHPLIAHLETNEENESQSYFELFVFQERIAFRFDGELKGIWKKDESHLVKGLIFMFLINVMYNKTEDDWLMTVHASAITNGKKTILFSAAPGKGKTTIAALLQANGYRLISDDFLPIDRNTFNAYPFPLAMSVKPGSTECLMPHFPELEEKELTYISPEKSVRYLVPNFIPDFSKEVFPVKEFIFIEYDKSVDFSFEKLETIQGMKPLLDQTWVAPKPGNAEILFDRVLETSFYQLTYSNNQKALEAIANLFNVE